MSNAEPAHPGRQMQTKVIVLLSVVVVVLAAGCALLFAQYRKTLARQQALPAVQADKLAASLGKFINLPGEQPQLVTVLDKTKLGDPNLITEARNGDQLLVYARAKQVLLYRPSSGKLIDMFHVQPPAPAAATIVPPASTTIPTGAAAPTH